jgi:hypothetical protein
MSGPSQTRHALGLPAGSIRALLAVVVLALSWLIVLGPLFQGEGDLYGQRLPAIFLYLQFLLVLILASFFSAHGGTIGPHISERSPLGLPKGTIRFLLLAGYLGLAGFLFYIRPEFKQLPDARTFLFLIAVLLGCFFLGNLITNLVRGMGGGILPPWFQDLQAWLAILALFVLGAIVVIDVVINRTLPMQDKIPMTPLQFGLVGLVGFYFGARS